MEGCSIALIPDLLMKHGDVTLGARLVFSGWAKTTAVTARGLVSRPRASGSVLRAHVLVWLSEQRVRQLAGGHTRSLRPLAQLTAPRSREAMSASTVRKVYRQKCGVVTSSSSCGVAGRIWTRRASGGSYYSHGERAALVC